MPDDMLEDAIQISKKAMDEHDFEEHGVDVSSNSLGLVAAPLRHIFQNKFQIIPGTSRWINWVICLL